MRCLIAFKDLVVPPAPSRPASFLKAQRRRSWSPRGKRPQPRPPAWPSAQLPPTPKAWPPLVEEAATMAIHSAGLTTTAFSYTFPGSLWRDAVLPFTGGKALRWQWACAGQSTGCVRVAVWGAGRGQSCGDRGGRRWGHVSRCVNRFARRVKGIVAHLDDGVFLSDRKECTPDANNNTRES